MNNPSEGKRGIIRLLADVVRVGLIAAAMTVALLTIAFAQMTESAIEQVPVSNEPAVTDASPTEDDKSTRADPSVQPIPPLTNSAFSAIDIEIQSRFNELRRELLEDRADTIYWWLNANTIVLTYFGVVVAIGGIVVAVVGFLGLRRFREVMNEARETAKAAAKHAEDAERHVKEIEKNRDISLELLRDMNAQTAEDNPDEASRAIEDVQNNPEASLMDKAVAAAVTLRRRGETEKAVEKWHAIANIAEGSDDSLAAKAWFSVGYLIRNQSVRFAHF